MDFSLDNLQIWYAIKPNQPTHQQRILNCVKLSLQSSFGNYSYEGVLHTQSISKTYILPFDKSLVLNLEQSFEGWISNLSI